MSRTAEARDTLTSIVQLLVKSLIDKEDEAVITPRDADTMVLFEISVAKSDFGKLIGRQGTNAHSLRLFIRAMGRKHGLDAFIKVIDPEGREYSVLDPAMSAPRNGGVKASE